MIISNLIGLNNFIFSLLKTTAFRLEPKRLYLNELDKFREVSL